MNKKLLEYIEKDCRLSAAQLATLCKKEEGDIKKAIAQLEANGTILGYNALINWEKTDRESVSALIELNVTPRKDRGFDAIAERISNYPEVKSLYLMSGGFDLAVYIEGKSLKDVAVFVARKLSALEDVTATATHFVLSTFKENGVIFGKTVKDERENV